METNRNLRSTKANALRVRRQAKARKLKELRKNILLGTLAFLSYIFILIIDVNGFLNFSVPMKLLCLAIFFLLSGSCLALTGGLKLIFSK